MSLAACVPVGNTELSSVKADTKGSVKSVRVPSASAHIKEFIKTVKIPYDFGNSTIMDNATSFGYFPSSSSSSLLSPLLTLQKNVEMRDLLGLSNLYRNRLYDQISRHVLAVGNLRTDQSRWFRVHYTCQTLWWCSRPLWNRPVERQVP